MHLMHPRRARLARNIYAILTFVLLSFFLGCQSQSTPNEAGKRALMQIQQGPSAEKNEFGLNRVNIPPGEGILFVKGPRPHLERFDGLVLDPIDLEPSDGALPWKSSTTNRLQKSFTRTLKKNLKQQKTWAVTSDPGPRVLRMRIYARELAYHPGLPHVSASRNASRPEPNKTTLVMELYDSNTNEILVQFIQRRDLPARVQAGSQTEVDRLRVYYSGFAKSMGDSLAELAQAVEDVRSNDELESAH
jgi:hypothetical protein